MAEIGGESNDDLIKAEVNVEINEWKIRNW